MESELIAEMMDEDFAMDMPPSPSKALFNDEQWEEMAKPRKSKKKGEDGEPVVAYDHYMLLGLEERYLCTEKQIKDGACPCPRGKRRGAGYEQMVLGRMLLREDSEDSAAGFAERWVARVGLVTQPNGARVR